MKTTPAPKAYSYVRFSTADQIKGDSLRRQTEGAAEWCKRNGPSLVESYRDLGVSAFKGKNAEVGALAAFLTLVKKGRIEKGSYLIVESLDRVSRNEILDAMELFTSIIKAGIVIVTLSDGQVYNREKINANPMQLMISLTVMTRAHEESKMKAIRVSAAWAAKRQNLKEEKMTAKAPGWLQLSADRKRFEPIPERVAVVKRIFEMATGGSGTYTITKTLRRDKVPTFGRARVWQASYIQKILSSRAVIGEFTPRSNRDGKETVFEPILNYFPAIVKPEVFATALQLRKTRPSYRGRVGANVFSHLAFDKETERPMCYVAKGKGRYQYLVSAAALEGLTDYCSWNYDEFLALFLTVCQKAALRPAVNPEPEHAELDLARMELDETEKQIARLVDFLLKGQSAGVQSKLGELEAKKLRLESKVKDLESEVLAKPADVSKVDWENAEAFRDNLRATVRRITVDAAAKSFHAQFLDGHEYSSKVDGRNAELVRNGAKPIKVPLSFVMLCARNAGFLR
jgi:DNA invertase Pin-like site-specific DNA recombinase